MSALIQSAYLKGGITPYLARGFVLPLV